MSGCAVRKLERTVGGRRLAVHCFASPEEGEGSNSLVVEAPGSLLMIDVPLLEPFGAELRGYVEALGKPVERLLVTHSHPDHWMSRSLFRGADCYALEETIEDIGARKEMYASYHRSRHGDRVCAELVGPDRPIEPGALFLDGIEMILGRTRDTEDRALLTVEIPGAGVLLAQDLVYNGTHAFVANRDREGELCVDRWISALRDLDTTGLATVVPGHGRPGDPTMIGRMIEYLEGAAAVIASTRSARDYTEAMLERFPDHALPELAGLSGTFIHGGE